MKIYKIKIAKRANEDYCTAIVLDRESGAEVAEYRLDVGLERSSVAGMRRAINAHLAAGDGLKNYQW